MKIERRFWIALTGNVPGSAKRSFSPQPPGKIPLQVSTFVPSQHAATLGLLTIERDLVRKAHAIDDKYCFGINRPRAAPTEPT
jgi:hypothetical protein